MDDAMMHAPPGGIHLLPWHAPVGRTFALIMAVLFVVSVGLMAITRETEPTRIVYCASGESHSGEALHVSLLQQGAEDPVRMRTGETGPDGCGEFQVIPRERPVMIVVWTDDGYSTGSTGWIDPQAGAETLAIELESQATPHID